MNDNCRSTPESPHTAVIFWSWREWLIFAAGCVACVVTLKLTQWGSISLKEADSPVIVRSDSPGLITEWFTPQELWSKSFRGMELFTRRTETLPTLGPLRLPPGQYQMAVTGDNHLGREVSLQVDKKYQAEFNVTLNDQYVWRCEKSYQGFEVLRHSTMSGYPSHWFE